MVRSGVGTGRCEEISAFRVTGLQGPGATSPQRLTAPPCVEHHRPGIAPGGPWWLRGVGGTGVVCLVPTRDPVAGPPLPAGKQVRTRVVGRGGGVRKNMGCVVPPIAGALSVARWHRGHLGVQGVLGLPGSGRWPIALRSWSSNTTVTEAPVRQPRRGRTLSRRESPIGTTALANTGIPRTRRFTGLPG